MGELQYMLWDMIRWSFDALNGFAASAFFMRSWSFSVRYPTGGNISPISTVGILIRFMMPEFFDIFFKWLLKPGEDDDQSRILHRIVYITNMYSSLKHSGIISRRAMPSKISSQPFPYLNLLVRLSFQFHGHVSCATPWCHCRFLFY